MCILKDYSKLELGIVGATGNIGRHISNDALKRFNLKYLNLVSSNKERLDIMLPEIVGCVERENRSISYRQIKDKLKTYENVDDPGFLNSDIIIFAARNNSVPFSSFKSRDDEYFVNKRIIKELAEKLKGYKGILIDVTNPLELNCELIAQKSGIDRNKIIAASCTDTLRFRRNLIEIIDKEYPEYKIKESDINKAIVIGEHGPNMVPIYSSIKIGDKPFSETKLNNKRLKDKIFEAINIIPTIIQTNRSSATNTVDPTLSVRKSIEAVLYGGYIPMVNYDGECFISNKAHFIKNNGSGKQVVSDKKYIAEVINKKERMDYNKARDSIIEKMYQVGLK